MLTLPVSEMVQVVGGRLLVGPDTGYVTGLVTDSREVESGCVFVAFAGERADGHRFAAEAIRAGARAIIVTREDPSVADAVRESRRHDVAVVMVDDALSAVQKLARHHRGRLNCPVVAITGSTGKTTTKDLLRSVLATGMSVVATESNKNNELGVPLTILRSGPGCGAVVVEMAMRGLGQITALCDIARPTVGLVTNVGQTHMELLGSQQAIATAKAELVKAIPESGLVLLNGDDAWSRELAKASAAPVSFYGVEEGNDVYARDLTVDEHGHPSFTLVSAAGSVAVAMAVPGRHNAYNATASAAVGLHLGLTLRQIAEGLENASMTPMRMEVFESADGVTVINDAYNANPTSMRAALRTLADMSDDGRRVAVIGDMAELGSLTELAHFEVGERVARLGLERLVTVGHLARRMGEGALAEGMDPGAVTSFDTVEAAVEFLRETLRSGDTVLVKASRSMGLERVVEGIIKADV